MEYLLPDPVLQALLPEVLFTGYTFWRTGENVIRGYARPPSLDQVRNEIEGGTVTQSHILPLRYRMPNEAARQNEIDIQLTDHADASTNRWWQGSELKYFVMVIILPQLSSKDYSKN